MRRSSGGIARLLLRRGLWSCNGFGEGLGKAEGFVGELLDARLDFWGDDGFAVGWINGDGMN